MDTGHQMFKEIHIRMPRVTRKRSLKEKEKEKEKGKHVSAIRKDIESFHAFLKASRTDVQVKKRFKELFGTALSDKRVDALLKMRPQKGGMAPLDYQLRSPEVHMSTVPYVQRGFGFANMDTTGLSPKEYLGSTPQMGGKRKIQKTEKRQRQRGGGIADFAASFSAQPFLSSAPLTTLQAGARLATGQVGLPSSLPEINTIRV